MRVHVSSGRGVCVAAWVGALTCLSGPALAQSAPEAAPAAPAPAASAASPAPASAPVDSSARTAKNVIFVEGLGNGGLYSLNYERFFTDDVNGRIGLDYISLSAADSQSSANVTVLFAPIMVNYLGIGSADHKLELGAGVLLAYASGSASGVGGTANGSGIGIGGTATVGYRYVPHDGGFTFNIGFTPVFGAGGFLPWGGIGVGAVF